MSQVLLVQFLLYYYSKGRNYRQVLGMVDYKGAVWVAHTFGVRYVGHMWPPYLSGTSAQRLSFTSLSWSMQLLTPVLIQCLNEHKMASLKLGLWMSCDCTNYAADAVPRVPGGSAVFASSSQRNVTRTRWMMQLTTDILSAALGAQDNVGVMWMLEVTVPRWQMASRLTIAGSVDEIVGSHGTWSSMFWMSGSG